MKTNYFQSPIDISERTRKDLEKIEALYKDSLEKNGELATTSHLFNLKYGYGKELENFSIQIIEDGNRILEGFKHILKNGQYSEIKEQNKESIEGLLYKIKAFITSPKIIEYGKNLGNDSFFAVTNWISELSEQTNEPLETNLAQVEGYINSVHAFYGVSNYLTALNSFIATKLSATYHGIEPHIIRLTFDSSNHVMKFKNPRVGGKETPTRLIHDLEKVLTEIVGIKRFYNKDRKLKPTTIAKHALSLKWFAESWDYSERQLITLIKELI